MTPIPGPVWRIEARKYDQQLHYRLPAYLLDDDGERLWFISQVGGQVEHVTRQQTWEITHRWDMIFWRRRWYNVYLNYTPAGAFDHFYCNVGLPPVVSGETLSFVDLDLDVRIWPDGQYAVLDEDEFIEHTAHYAYPEPTQNAARQAVDDILALWRAGHSPFDRLHGPA